MSGGLELGGGGGAGTSARREEPFVDATLGGRTAPEALESVEATLVAGEESLRSSLTRSRSLFFFFFFRSDPSTDAPSTEPPSLALRFSDLLVGSCLSILIPPTSITLDFVFLSPNLSALFAVFGCSGFLADRSVRSVFFASSALRLSG